MTSVLATPTTASALLADRDSDAAAHVIKSFNCGGSTIPLDLLNGFHDRFGIWLREQWGMTETHGTVSGHPTNGEPPVVGSVGYALPYHQVGVFELDDQNRYIRTCAPGERGVLVIKGFGVAPGYLKASLDPEFFVKDTPDGEVWANTGDVGAMDDSGYIWLFGRAKDVIVRGGHNIDPKLIEEVLASHSEVQLAAAVGRPDARKGELPIAYVQLTEGSALTAETLIEFCRETIQERAAIPAEIIFLPEMPMTPVGKISKPALRIDALRRVAADVAATSMPKGTRFSLTIDERGKRASVVITIHGGESAADEIGSQLRTAFAGFEFATRIEFPAAEKPGPVPLS